MNYYLGIDVSKGYADFALINEQKQPMVNNFQLDDTPDGHNKLGDFIRTLFKQHQDLTVVATAESTGGYENNWLDCLKKLQRCYAIKVARLNPKGVHHHHEAKLNRSITDAISARLIAEYTLSHQDIIPFDQPDQTYWLRKQWTLIKLLSVQNTQLLNQLDNLVYQANPELMVYHRNSWPAWLLQLLASYPTAKDLVQASLEQLVKIPHLDRSRANNILDQARQSVASATDPVSGEMIKTIVAEITHKNKLINVCKQSLIDNCSLPDVELLTSIIGIGKFSAVGLIVEIGTWLRFESAAKMASFFGLHPILKQSGDKNWVARMSKQGSKEVRALLFMCALVAIQRNPVIRDLYAYSLKKGKSKMSALGICMHKLLRIIYGVLKSGNSFDPAIDQANRTRKPVQRKFAKQEIRRLQPVDANAPVSARQNKKRKEQSQSQGELVTIGEIKAPALSRCTT
ncbi:MAG TPA: IS110 family transposase [bacterium]|nr:IS110 family transposase [bacterium]HPG45241.1 IS110 family transposase [bacterium]HPM99040.1 IS110 family transposase [bacterium]